MDLKEVLRTEGIPCISIIRGNPSPGERNTRPNSGITLHLRFPVVTYRSALGTWGDGFELGEASVAPTAEEPPVTAVVLAGGKGTRLRSVTRDDVAKPAVLVNGRPFIDYVLAQFRHAGFGRVVLLLGHKADTVVRALQEHGRSGMLWTAEVEDTPLGTAGCLARLRATASRRFLVVNGDTYVSGLNIQDLLGFHRSKEAALTVALIRVRAASDYGTAQLDKQSRVTGFLGEGRSDEGLVNCGVYVVERDVLEFIPEGKSFSMERELIPLLLREKVGIYGYRFEGRFYDIGTPERLEEFARVAESGAIADGSQSSGAAQG
jgi:mannose-1-phosphate guanylyltransferase